LNRKLWRVAAGGYTQSIPAALKSGQTFFAPAKVFSAMIPADKEAEALALSDPGNREVFERFTRRLIALARGHIHAKLQHKVDAEDVVQSAYKSLVLRYGDDVLRTQRLDSLWNLLSLITLRKCADRVRHFQADCRDVARENPAGADSQFGAMWEAVGREPLPEHAAALSEIVEAILGELTPTERPIIELSLQGYSTSEVSEQLGRAERSVRRVRERVKQRLERR
jgi:RNA polymerase sigma-70 factor (ECF subfamily)